MPPRPRLRRARAVGRDGAALRRRSTSSSSAPARPASPPRAESPPPAGAIVLIEATDHIGGRCITDTRIFGVPYDRGAHWIYLPDLNPLTKLAPRARHRCLSGAAQPEGAHRPALRARRRARGFSVRPGSRHARDRRCGAQGRHAVRAGAAERSRRLARDASSSCSGRMVAARIWRRCRRSTSPRAAERNAAAFCRQGFGALLATLAEGLHGSARRRRRSRSIPTRRRRSRPRRARSTARAAIVTVPTNVVASGGIKFTPELGHRQIDAFGRLSLGSYDHIALELIGNPLGLESDDLVFEKSADTHTAAILANVSGTPLCLIDVAGASAAICRRRAKPRWSTSPPTGSPGSMARKSRKRSAARRRRAGTATLCARRLVGRGAGRPVRAPAIAGSGRRRCLVSPARPRTRPCGARSAAPGNPASAPPTRCCASSARSSTPAPAEARSRQRQAQAEARRRRSAASRAARPEPQHHYGGTPNIMRAGALTLTPATRRRCACRLRRRFSRRALRSRRPSWSCRAAAA